MTRSRYRIRLPSLVVAFMLVIHVGLVLRSYPPGVFIANEIPLKGDVSRYFATAHGSLGVSGWQGYDPHFMAGYPVGGWNSMGKKGFELVAHAAPFIGLPRLFYLILVGSAIISPLVLWSASLRISGRCSQLTLLAFCLGFWHFSTNIAYFWNFGNVFFPLACCLAVLLVRLATEALTASPSVRRAVAMGLVAAAIFYLHTVVLLGAAFPLAFVVFANRRNCRDWRVTRQLLLSLTVFLALSSWWLFPLLSDTGLCESRPEAYFDVSIKHVIMDVFSDRTYQHHFDRNFLFHAAVILGISSLVSARNSPSSTHKAFVVAGCWCLFISWAYFLPQGAKSVQPHRFLIPATLFFLGPAAVAFTRMRDAIRQAGRPQRWAFAVLLVLLTPELTSYAIDALRPAKSCGMPKHYEPTVAAIRALPSMGRIACDDIQLGHILPYCTRKPVLGGLSAQAFVKHHFAGFDDQGRLFGTPPEAWQQVELTRYLREYAVGYALFSRAEWIALAERMPDLFEHIARLPAGRLYKVRSHDGYIASGGGKVAATYDRIAVSDISSGTVVLRFHYSERLVCDRAGVKIEPVSLIEADPIPFIRVTGLSGMSSFNLISR